MYNKIIKQFQYFKRYFGLACVYDYTFFKSFTFFMDWVYFCLANAVFIFGWISSCLNMTSWFLYLALLISCIFAIWESHLSASFSLWASVGSYFSRIRLGIAWDFIDHQSFSDFSRCLQSSSKASLKLPIFGIEETALSQPFSSLEVLSCITCSVKLFGSAVSLNSKQFLMAFLRIFGSAFWRNIARSWKSFERELSSPWEISAWSFSAQMVSIG